MQLRKTTNGELMKKKPHILKLQDRCGYKCVNLFKGGRSHTLNIHRLVAEAFYPILIGIQL